MVFNDRPTYKDRHARNSSWPGETDLQSKAEYICADLSSRPSAFPLQSCGGPYIINTYPAGDLSFDCGRLTQHLAMKERPDIWSDNASDVLFGQHFGCAFVQLFGASHFFEAGDQIIGPQAPFLGALKVVDNLATVHHD